MGLFSSIMFDFRLWRASKSGYKIIKSHAPVDRGNLRDHGITLEKTGRSEYTISIGGSAAPYAVYTNEVWVAPRWNNKPNPNEHWIERAVEDAVLDIAKSMGGKLATIDGEEARWRNESYWDSEEGKAKIKEYGIDDIYSIVG